MVESGRVPGKGIICASAEKLSGKVVESERVPGKRKIRASTEKLSGRVPKNSRIRVSTEKW